MAAKKSLFLIISAALVFTAALGCGGGGGSDDGIDRARIQGQAILPQGVDPQRGVAANAPLQVIDFTRPTNANVVATGTTDANGRYDVTVAQSPIVAVVVQGRIQVSGLVQADRNKDVSINKDFTVVTDIACRAGVKGLTEGTLTPDDFAGDRIANLESAAAIAVDSGNIDFSSESSINDAVQFVINSTDNGEHPPLTL